jgi:hypothetical protein
MGNKSVTVSPEDREAIRLVFLQFGHGDTQALTPHEFEHFIAFLLEHWEQYASLPVLVVSDKSALARQLWNRSSPVAATSISWNSLLIACGLIPPISAPTKPVLPAGTLSDTVTTSRQRTVSILRDTTETLHLRRPRGYGSSRSRPPGPPPRPPSLTAGLGHTSEFKPYPTAPDPPAKEFEEKGPPSVQNLFSQSDYLLRNNGEQIKLEEVWKNQVIGIFFSTCG